MKKLAVAKITVVSSVIFRLIMTFQMTATLINLFTQIITQSLRVAINF